MKEWDCMQVDRHEKIPVVIEKFCEDGWRLHTFTMAEQRTTFRGHAVNYFLLFERGQD